MRLAATLKSLSKLVDEIARKLLEIGDQVPYKDLSEDQKEALKEKMMFLSNGYDKGVNELTSDPVVKSAVYQWIMNEGISDSGNDISYWGPDGAGIEVEKGDFDKTLEMFRRAKETGEIEGDILKYRVYRDWKDAVDQWARDHEMLGNVDKGLFGQLKKVYSADGIEGYYLDSYEKSKEILNADNFGIWCIKEEDYFDDYGPSYYLFVDSSKNPYMLVSWRKTPQIKNKLNKPFDVVDDRLRNALLFLNEKGIFTEKFNRISHDLVYLRKDSVLNEVFATTVDIEELIRDEKWDEAVRLVSSKNDLDKLLASDIGSVYSEELEELITEYSGLNIGGFFNMYETGGILPKDAIRLSSFFGRGQISEIVNYNGPHIEGFFNDKIVTLFANYKKSFGRIGMFNLMSRVEDDFFKKELLGLTEDQKLGVLNYLSSSPSDKLESISDVFYSSLKPIPEGFVTRNEVLIKKLQIEESMDLLIANALDGDLKSVRKIVSSGNRDILLDKMINRPRFNRDSLSEIFYLDPSPYKVTEKMRGGILQHLERLSFEDMMIPKHSLDFSGVKEFLIREGVNEAYPKAWARIFG